METENTVPALLSALRPTLHTVAVWVDGSYGAVQAWQADRWQPPPDRRRKLVAAVQMHASMLMALARAVEREGEGVVDGGAGTEAPADAEAFLRQYIRVVLAAQRGDNDT